MPQVIADTYEIVRRLGAGGGGVVYLAKHLRLDKEVVVKADKRKITAKPESLRREVDALKNLSHTYIPQVYDFVQENETVYTVMDYIEGESLDNPLKRGETASQAQIVQWACQLLEALSYLHGRPPHGILHADIKPANIMLTPQGDIRLIDFNIALALGEDGAVSVGRSLGYASPEHLGLDFAPSGATTRNATTDSGLRATTVIDSPETVLESRVEAASSSSTTGRRVMLDVRSDIYGLGATLYHLLTGKRPAGNVKDVVPLSDKAFSPGIASIINKSMSLNPELRFQTADEMLYAFEHLRENDPRTIRFKRIRNTASALCAGFLLIGAVTAFAGLKTMQEEQAAIALQEGLRAEEEKVRAETEKARANAEALEKEIEQAKNSANESEKSLQRGNRDKAIELALAGLPAEGALYDVSDVPEAVLALTNALGVYNLADGFKAHKTVELPSAPLFMEISTDGKAAAVVYAYSVAAFDTSTGEIISLLPAEKSALAEVRFINNDTIIYAGEDGVTAYSLAEKAKLWTGKPATAISVSADGKLAAAVYKDEDFATVYNTANGQELNRVSFNGKRRRVAANDIFANPGDNLLALNHNGTMLGASFSDGSLWVYDLNTQDGDIELLDGTSGFTGFQGGFFQQYFAFAATAGAESLFAVIDTDELVQTGAFEYNTPLSAQVTEGGICFQADNVLVSIHPVTGEQAALVKTFEKIEGYAISEAHTLITTEDNFIFFDKNANQISARPKEHNGNFVKLAEGIALIAGSDAPTVQILQYESHPAAEVFSYDPSYVHDEARISQEDSTVMLFSYKGFRLYSMAGEVVTEVSLPDTDSIHDQQFIRDENGARLEVIYNDGKILAYSAADGSLLHETQGEQPDLMLYEEFFTDTLRIESPLHGTPAAYDINTGELICQLEKDAYLTYVTQVDGGIITEYVTAEGYRYGLLLNDKCETIASLPYLCDIVGGKLIFNYPTGNLRQARIYNIGELTELAKE